MWVDHQVFAVCVCVCLMSTIIIELSQSIILCEKFDFLLMAQNLNSLNGYCFRKVCILYIKISFVSHFSFVFMIAIIHFKQFQVNIHIKFHRKNKIALCFCFFLYYYVLFFAHFLHFFLLIFTLFKISEQLHSLGYDYALFILLGFL